MHGSSHRGPLVSHLGDNLEHCKKEKNEKAIRVSHRADNKADEVCDDRSGGEDSIEDKEFRRTDVNRGYPAMKWVREPWWKREIEHMQNYKESAGQNMQ